MQAVTSQGSAYGRFTGALATKNLLGAEMALREMGTASLASALDYLVLLAELRPERAAAAAIRWHGRFELEARVMTLAESQLALAALTSVCAGEPDALEILRRLLRRVQPTLVSHIR